MLFGLSNAPASFQSYINKILAEKLDIFVIVYLNDIFIYTQNPGQAHVNAVWWVLKKLRKNGFLTNLKKCCFHKDKVRFLEYVMSNQEVWIEEERINAIQNCPKPKFIYDIQVFFSFANFYCCFIQGFSRIAAPLTSMLKISPIPISVMQKLIDLVDEFGGGNCGENEARKTFTSTKRPTRADYLSSDHVNHAISNFVSNSAKNVSNYLTANAIKVFDQLRQAFTEAPIF